MPASFIQRSTVSGSRLLVSTSRNSALALGSARTPASISLALRAAARIASGWISSPWRSASANIWTSRTGSSARKASSGTASRPRSSMKPSSLPGPAAEGGQADPAAAAGELVVEMGEEQPGQVADRLRVQEIVAHEALDRRLAGPVGIVHPGRDLALIVEGQPVLGSAGGDVKVAAHRPQKALGALELPQLRRREQADLDQLGDRAEPIGIFADPEQSVEIAKAAFAFLDVGLDHVAAVAHALVAGVALVELLLDERADIARDHMLPEARRDLVEQGLVAPDVARLRGSRCGRYGRPGRAGPARRGCARSARP